MWHKDNLRSAGTRVSDRGLELLRRYDACSVWWVKGWGIFLAQRHAARCEVQGYSISFSLEKLLM